MKRILHVVVVFAVVAVAALGLWSHARASNEGGGAEEIEVKGVVDAFDAATVTIDGVAYPITDQTEVEGTLAIGAEVELEYVINPDGSITVVEVEVEDEDEDSDSVDEIEDDEDEDEDEDEDDDEDEDEDDDEDDDDDEDEDEDGDDD